MADGRTQWEREQRRLTREIEQKQRAEERARIAAEKERQRQYAAKRKATAEKKTAQLAHTFEELESILRTGLQRPGRFDVTSLYHKSHAPELKLGALASPVPEPEFVAPRTPGIVSRLFGGQKRYQQDLEVAQQRHQEQLAAAQHQERERQHQVAAKQREHEAAVRRIQAESQ